MRSKKLLKLQWYNQREYLKDLIKSRCRTILIKVSKRKSRGLKMISSFHLSSKHMLSIELWFLHKKLLLVKREMFRIKVFNSNKGLSLTVLSNYKSRNTTILMKNYFKILWCLDSPYSPLLLQCLISQMMKWKDRLMELAKFLQAHKTIFLLMEKSNRRFYAIVAMSRKIKEQIIVVLIPPKFQDQF